MEPGKYIYLIGNKLRIIVFQIGGWVGSEILLEWIPNSELFYPHNFKDISRQAKLRVQQISNFFLALRSSFSLVEYFTWPNRFAHLYHYGFCLTKMLVAFKVFYKQDLRSRTLGWLIDSAPSLLLGKNGSAKRNNCKVIFVCTNPSIEWFLSSIFSTFMRHT